MLPYVPLIEDARPGARGEVARSILDRVARANNSCSCYKIRTPLPAAAFQAPERSKYRDRSPARIDLMPETNNPRLDRVLAQLRLYEHPLLNFSARAKGDAVEVIIQFKDESIPVHTYYFDLHPRDLDDPQFEWTFQRQLYDALHDYFVEMFIRTPQDRELRQRQDRQREDRQRKGS